MKVERTMYQPQGVVLVVKVWALGDCSLLGCRLETCLVQSILGGRVHTGRVQCADKLARTPKTRSQRAVKENIRAYLIRIQILTIKNRVQPCHLSSSIYNGGQDVYSHPQEFSQASGYSTFNKEGGEDDSGCELHREIGGKGVSITKSRPATACEFPLDSLRK